MWSKLCELIAKGEEELGLLGCWLIIDGQKFESLCFIV